MTPAPTAAAPARLSPMLFAALACACLPAGAHGVQDGDAAFIAQSAGAQLVPFAYLGARHMVTGYDHLLFLLGVVFFLRRPRDVLLYVTLFAAGHSVTLLSGVLLRVQVNTWLVDAVIGLSVAYKAIDNLDGWRTLFGATPDRRAAVLGFGLIHGLGLATRLQELHLSRQALIPNLLAFHVGIELGQIAALCLMMALLFVWRRRPRFNAQALLANGAMLGAGLLLTGYQLAGWLVQQGIVQ